MLKVKPHYSITKGQHWALATVDRRKRCKVGQCSGKLCVKCVKC